MAAYQAPPSLGFSRQEHWSRLPFPSPIHESEKCKWSRSVMSDSATPRTEAHQAPPSMGFSRQEYWSGLPLPSPIVPNLFLWQWIGPQYMSGSNEVMGVAKSWTWLSNWTTTNMSGTFLKCTLLHIHYWVSTKKDRLNIYHQSVRANLCNTNWPRAIHSTLRSPIHNPGVHSGYSGSGSSSLKYGTVWLTLLTGPEPI